jgi:hypothetical protein
MEIDKELIEVSSAFLARTTCALVNCFSRPYSPIRSSGSL